jgi:glycosyltransferase involved in cell wall biosynthesis
MIGHAIGFLKPDEAIVVAGSVSDYFEQKYDIEDVKSAIFWKRVICVGQLTESRLRALIGIADCLLLPITEGGGSNLKTAEALLSGKPIVGTSHAFRSFDEFIDLPDIYISETPAAFRTNMAHALRSARGERTQSESLLVQGVTWSECLNEAIEVVKEL